MNIQYQEQKNFSPAAPNLYIYIPDYQFKIQNFQVLAGFPKLEKCLTNFQNLMTDAINILVAYS